MSKRYNTSNIPKSFLNDDNSFDLVVAAIDKIERDLELMQDANIAYTTIKELIVTEMDSKLPKRIFNDSRKKASNSLHRSPELDDKWDAVCTRERDWLRCNGSSAEKRRRRALYVSKRRQFEKMNKKSKRKYQLSEQPTSWSKHS